MLAALHTVLATVVVVVFVVAVLAFAAYALVRPFTHVHYHRSGGRLWDHRSSDSLWKPVD
jgi:hypothetical protein